MDLPSHTGLFKEQICKLYIYIYNIFSKPLGFFSKYKYLPYRQSNSSLVYHVLKTRRTHVLCSTRYHVFVPISNHQLSSSPEWGTLTFFYGI